MRKTALQPLSKAILFTTGDNLALIRPLELGFIKHLRGQLKLEICRLGRVASLFTAYHEAALHFTDPDTLLIFCHEDIRPLIMPDLPAKPTIGYTPETEWFRPAIDHPTAWVEVVKNLAMCKDSGWMGVAGSRGITKGYPWWQYPDLSGSTVHAMPRGQITLNTYGNWGRAAVLDGMCLMIRSSAYRKLAPPDPRWGGFHYYDMDMCLRAHAVGLKNWTVPLVLVHDRSGARTSPGKKAFHEGRELFETIHGDQLPLIVPFETFPF